MPYYQRQGLSRTVKDCHGPSWTVMDCHGLLQFIGEGSYLYRLLSRRYYRRIAPRRIAHLRIGDGFCHRVHGGTLGAGAAAFVGHMVRPGREEEKPPFAMASIRLPGGLYFALFSCNFS